MSPLGMLSSPVRSLPQTPASPSPRQAERSKAGQGWSSVGFMQQAWRELETNFMLGEALTESCPRRHDVHRVSLRGRS